ncbi:DNA recombination protein RmuC [uncultured Alloprevotella sp.]|uniref:DNA recombination protein RmuC n=1 Tax=uncultured Alloprevotella sp. TaxID=1283315 RepID=UPI00325FA582
MEVILYIVIGVVLGMAIAYVLHQKRLMQLNLELRQKTTELHLLREQADKEAQLRAEKLTEQMNATKEQMTNLAQQLLERNAEKLKSENTDSIGQITQPLKEAIGEMRRELTQNRETSAANSATFQEQLRQMLESNERVGEKAANLAQALRGDNKAQGNWGEVILGNLLSCQGLREGIDYDLQTRLRDDLGQDLKNIDTGASMQPDAILHYPHEQDVIIDAKVSLKAYDDYVNAQSEEECTAALAAHVRSIRDQYQRLSKKDYSSYVQAPRKSIDFVVMFVPNESALQLALTADSKLWYDAFDHKVLIAGELNLMAILRIIQIVWRQYQQAENQQRVFLIAEELLDRLGDFLKRYQKLGDALRNSLKAYEDAEKKVFSGRQSVVRKGNELKALGAKENPNRPIPSERADMEQLEQEEEMV